MQYSLTIKKNEILPFATTGMELECSMLSKIRQTEKDKYMISLMWNLRNKTDELSGEGSKNKIKTERETNHKRLLNTENKQGCWRGVGWVDGLNRQGALRGTHFRINSGC